VRGSDSKPLLWILVAANVTLGLVFFAVDVAEARAQARLAEEAVRWARARGGETVWFVGHWGFQFYAERAGGRPLVPDRSPVGPDDWVVVPAPQVNRQVAPLPGDQFKRVHVLEQDDFLPWRTGWSYYGGRLPLVGRREPRLTVTVWRRRAGAEPAGASRRTTW
jgi:hypothetical protein